MTAKLKPAAYRVLRLTRIKVWFCPDAEAHRIGAESPVPCRSRGPMSTKVTLAAETRLVELEELNGRIPLEALSPRASL